MKALPFVAITLIACLFAIPHARGAWAPERPPGVKAEAWVPMGEGAGFVVTGNTLPRGTTVQHDPTVMIPQPQLRGYFVAKRGNTWYRIDTLPEPRFEPAQLK